MHGRRSVRRYTAEPVDRALLADAIWAAAQAPTPPVSGDLPWAFCVIEGVDRIAAHGDRAKQYARDHQPPGRPWTWPDRAEFKVFWDAPAVVVICGRAVNPEAPFDCCRAAQNLSLALHASGLGSCWVGAPLPWLQSPGVADEVGLPAGLVAFAVLALGHPAERPVGHPRVRPDIVWAGAGR